MTACVHSLCSDDGGKSCVSTMHSHLLACGRVIVTCRNVIHYAHSVVKAPMVTRNLYTYQTSVLYTVNEGLRGRNVLQSAD